MINKDIRIAVEMEKKEIEKIRLKASLNKQRGIIH